MNLYNNLLPARAISPIADSSDNTVLVSEILDTQGFEEVLLLILCLLYTSDAADE